MRDYRAYLVGPDGHFQDFTVIAAPDDEAAIDAARQYVYGVAVEVWELDRKIAVLPSSE